METRPSRGQRASTERRRVNKNGHGSSGPQANSSAAVIYARVSSKEQEREGFSIPAQLKLLREYAAQRAFTIQQEFVDVETAKTSGRPAFGQMVALIRKSAIRTLLVEKTDRLYRNLKDWVTLDELELEIHFVKENVILSRESRSSEKFIHGIKVLMAKNYIDNLSEETRKGMLEKAEEGIWPSFAPLGYENTEGPDGKKTIVPDGRAAPLVRRVFEWYAAGLYSVREVARMARAEGLVFRKSHRPVTAATVHAILRNPIYAGEFDWDGRRYQGKYEPVISYELWDRVQDVMNGRNARKTRFVRHAFAFSGLITCGHCGSALVGEVKKSRYVYYHCTGYRGKCPEPYAREELISSKFAALLDDLVIEAEMLEWLKAALRSSHADERKYHDEAVARLQRDYTRLQSRLDVMYDDKLDGRIDASFFDRKASEIRLEQDRLTRTLQSHQNANQTYFEEGAALLELAARARELFEQQEPKDQRKLLNYLVSNCSWRDGRLSAEYRQPFDIVAKMAVETEQRRPLLVDPQADFANWLPR